MVLMSVCVLGDFLWMHAWLPFWHDGTVTKWNRGLHILVSLCVVAECLLKLIIVISLTFVKQVELDNR